MAYLGPVSAWEYLNDLYTYLMYAPIPTTAPALDLETSQESPRNVVDASLFI
jgi:hypothetical protein